MSDFEEFFAQEGITSEPHRTVMLCAFEGWNDAGQAATHALQHLITAYSQSSREVDHICCGSFYDYTVIRPVMVSIDGKRKIMWPETTFTEINVNSNLTLLIEIGPEPNFKWTEFAQRSLRVADDREVTEIITLGSMFADCTHTRPLPLTLRDTSSNIADENSYTGPIGIPSVVNFTAIENGFKASSLWVSLPTYTQYVESLDNPSATLQIIEKLSDYLGVDLDNGDLPALALKWKTQADMLSTLNPEVESYIKKMEDYYDRDEAIRALSPDAANNLISETESFLRSMDTD